MGGEMRLELRERIRQVAAPEPDPESVARHLRESRLIDAGRQQKEARLLDGRPTELVDALRPEIPRKRDATAVGLVPMEALAVVRHERPHAIEILAYQRAI